jgi:hypothetical protein
MATVSTFNTAAFPPDLKVNLRLSGPSINVKMGDAVPVRILVTPATLPQVIWSVTTMFAWDISKLEFMGLDKTGAKSAVLSAMDMPCATCVNESSIPKDGHAYHNFLSTLGDKTPIDKETLIVTLKFKAVSDFTQTTIEVINKSDPRVKNLKALDDTGILGSGLAGANVMGTITNAVIKGIL